MSKQTDHTMPWSHEQLARFNEAWFNGRSLRYCDSVTGNRCITVRHAHARQFDPLIRILWGWLGGSDGSGVLWDTANIHPRVDRTDLPLSANESEAIKTIETKRRTLSPGRAALLSDAYLLHLLNRRHIVKELKPSLGLL